MKCKNVKVVEPVFLAFLGVMLGGLGLGQVRYCLGQVRLDKFYIILNHFTLCFMLVLHSFTWFYMDLHSYYIIFTSCYIILHIHCFTLFYVIFTLFPPLYCIVLASFLYIQHSFHTFLHCFTQEKVENVRSVVKHPVDSLHETVYYNFSLYIQTSIWFVILFILFHYLIIIPYH